MKLPVIQREDYTVYFEPVDYKGRYITFIHCDVHNQWTKSVKESLQTDFNSLIGLRSDPIFCLHDKEDRKHRKFINMFGFKYLYEGEELDNKQIFVLEIDNG